MGRIGWSVVGVLGVAAAAAILFVGVELLRPPTESLDVLARPRAGEARADYLADGTPVWVIGHRDGEVSVLSAFDSHRPANLAKLLWWCPTAEALEDPAHGSKYDGFGLRIGGPAPAGLPRYATVSGGGAVTVGALGSAPPFDQAPAGPSESDREWCTDADPMIYHRFEGWPVHDSPTQAVAAAPDRWILLDGELIIQGDGVILCAIGDCSDAVRAEGVWPVNLPDGFSPLNATRYIARVRDGALVDLARVIVTER